MVFFFYYKAFFGQDIFDSNDLGEDNFISY